MTDCPVTDHLSMLDMLCHTIYALAFIPSLILPFHFPHLMTLSHLPRLYITVTARHRGETSVSERILPCTTDRAAPHRKLICENAAGKVKAGVLLSMC